MNRAGRTVAAAVAVHLALSVAHGVTHVTVPVHIPGWQFGYAVVVILLAPVVGVALLAAGRMDAGLRLVLLAGVAALAFEGLLHFVVVNPDHVSTVGIGATVFATTAALTTVGDAFLVAVAGWVVWRRRRGSAVGPDAGAPA